MEIRIHIDETPRHSPNPTTGQALYALGHVREGHVLFREVTGDREDIVVPHNGDAVHLHEDEHFHSGEEHKKEWKISVNGKQKIVTHRVLSYDEIVKLAFPVPPPGDQPTYKVTFEHAASHPHDGSLATGGKVKVKTGTEFDVVHTNRS